MAKCSATHDSAAATPPSCSAIRFHLAGGVKISATGFFVGRVGGGVA